MAGILAVRGLQVIYADFLEFKRGILDCVRSDLASLQRMVRHQGKEVALTNREFQPWLDFVIARSSCSSSWTIPTATPPLPRSWARPGPTRPVSREVRNYVRRVRKILADLAIPVDLVNKPSHDYLDRGTPQGRKEDPGHPANRSPSIVSRTWAGGVTMTVRRASTKGSQIPNTDMSCLRVDIPSGAAVLQQFAAVC